MLFKGINMVEEDYKKQLILITHTKGYYDRQTGKYVEGKETKVEFKGALLPLSEKDLKFLEGGNYSSVDIKLYTDRSIKNNSYIIDATTNKKYKVYAGRDYNIIDSNFFRYFLKGADKIDG